MINRIDDPVTVLLSGQTGSGTVSVLRTVSEKIKAEAKEVLSTAGRVGKFCLLNVRLYKTDAFSAALRRLAFRLTMSKVMIYMVEGTERRAETADPRLLETADGNEDRRRPA